MIMDVLTRKHETVTVRKIDSGGEHDYAIVNTIGESVAFYDRIYPFTDVVILRRSYADRAYKLPAVIVIVDNKTVVY